MKRILITFLFIINISAQDTAETVVELQVLQALSTALYYLELQNITVTLGYIPYSESLRRMADEEEQRERDIAYIRETKTLFLEYLRRKAHK